MDIINVFLSKLSHKNQETVRPDFPAPFWALMAKISGCVATKITWSSNIFMTPFELFCRTFGHLATVLEVIIIKDIIQNTSNQLFKKLHGTFILQKKSKLKIV